MGPLNRKDPSSLKTELALKVPANSIRPLVLLGRRRIVSAACTVSPGKGAPRSMKLGFRSGKWRLIAASFTWNRNRYVGLEGAKPV